MGEISGIAWTDATFNPWWGCARVSPGCENCYAEQLATVRRKLPVWGVDADRKPMSEEYWRQPEKWNRKAEAAGVRMRVFCASMADVFERTPERNEQARRVQALARARLWPLIVATPWLDWLLLTKRPENVAGLVPWGDDWPSNVWLGVTAEDQQRADERIPILLSLPARVRFVSYEPALGPVELDRVLMICKHWQSADALPHAPWHPPYPKHFYKKQALVGASWKLGLHWVIVGGESGPGARPFDLMWARSMVEQCLVGGVAAFVKQLGADPIDGTAGCSVVLRDRRKGGDPEEWPPELRVREFPRERDQPAFATPWAHRSLEHLPADPTPSVDVGSYVEVLYGVHIGKRGFVRSRIPPAVNPSTSRHETTRFDVMIGEYGVAYAADELRVVAVGEARPSSSLAPAADDALAMLRSLEWAGTTRLDYDITAPGCPSCGGVDPSCNAATEGDLYGETEGHLAGCKLDAFLQRVYLAGGAS